MVSGVLMALLLPTRSVVICYVSCNVRYSPSPHFLLGITGIQDSLYNGNLDYIPFCIYMVFCLTCQNPYWNKFTMRENVSP